MPSVVTALEKAELEITNLSSANDLVGISFAYGGKNEEGRLKIPPGGSQRFPKFSHLYVECPDGNGSARIRNTCELPVAVFKETFDTRTEMPILLQGHDRTYDLEPNQQFFFLPRADPYVPPPPMIVGAEYRKNNLVVDTDNEVVISWNYPMDHMYRIIGFNHYRVVYDGNFPMHGGRLNQQPVPGDHFVVRDWIVLPNQNIRYTSNSR